MKLETSKKQVGVLKYYNYYIDIIQDDEEQIFEFWLYKKDYGVKMHCVGIKELDFEIIENNIEDWIDVYNKTYVYN